VATQSDPGNLEYPDNVSAAYPVEAVTAGVSVTATWVGASALSLSVDCPDGTQSRSGPSGLTVASTGTGDCVVTLSEPPATNETVSYSLTIETS
jgi:hypothetical protein